MAHQKSLKQKATSGIVWTAFQRYSTILIQFISGIILARLLTPYDYGCIGMLAIFMSLAESFIDGGFGSALIQKKRPTQEDYSTIFFWNLGMASFLYLLLFISAPYIAHFYKIPLLCPVLRVQGIILFIYAFNIVQRNQLQKKMNFKILSIVTITTSLISLSVTIYMAYRGGGVWSLVAQHMLTAAIPAIVFWFYIKWRPMWIFSKKSFKELFGFGFYMFLTNLLNQFCNQIQGLLIGKLYSPATLGYYSKAQSTEKLSSTSVSQIMTQVTYPLYAEVQDDKVRLANMIRKITMTLSYITFPLMFVLLLCAKPLFVLLYSDRWLGSVPYFQILCIAGLAFSLQSVNHQSIAAIGKSRTMFAWTFVKRLIGLMFVLTGLYLYGMKGLMVGIVLNTWFSYFVNIYLVSKHIGYKWWKQLLDIMPQIVVSCFIAIFTFYLTSVLKMSLYSEGIVRFSLFVFSYMSWSFLLKPESFKCFVEIINPIINKITKKKKNEFYKNMDKRSFVD